MLTALNVAETLGTPDLADLADLRSSVKRHNVDRARIRVGGKHAVYKTPKPVTLLCCRLFSQCQCVRTGPEVNAQRLRFAARIVAKGRSLAIASVVLAL